MAVNGDVMELVQILDSAGFSAVAGEILIEIGLGREQRSVKDDVIDASRVPIPDQDQLAEAVRLVRLLIIEPARRLAEAEEIAGSISGRGVVPIVFADVDGSSASSPVAAGAGVSSRDRTAIDALDQVLDLIAPSSAQE